MAFCNSCGTTLTPGTRFCSKCGAAILGSAAAPVGATPSPTPPTPPTPPVVNAPVVPAVGGGGALKVILIVVAVVVFVGILGVVSAGFFAWHVAHHTHIRQNGDRVNVETPFGSVATTKDPEEAARNLGVELYPGAEVMKEGAASTTFGGVHTAALSATSSDSVDKVSSFYKAKFPNAMVTSSDSGRCDIVANDHKSMVTINIEAEGDKTKIQITNVTHKSDSNSSSN
jgi:zinc-ribbon domain